MAHLELIEKKTVLETYPFNVEELRLRANGKEFDRPWYRLAMPDWVNVLPVTTDRRAILIRQSRPGVLRQVLEIPGGVIDKHERDATMAAVRELEEETGFVSQRILPLAAINPNPAIQTNLCHFFLALDCMPAVQRQHFPDADEHIEVELVPIEELEGLVRTGQINHALCGLCIMLAKKYLGLS